MRSARARLLLVAHLALAARAAAAADPQNAYALVVERFADGDRNRAVPEVVRFPAARLANDVRSLVASLALLPEPHLRNVLVKAGAMLHTHAARGLRAGRDMPASESHMELASLYVLLADRLPADQDLRSFSRRWYLAAALERQQYLETESARAYLDAGLQRFPEDADLLLAKGSLEETLGTWRQLDGLTAGTTRLTRTVPAPLRTRVEARVHVQQAEELYRRALAAAPLREEAHLRRGRTLGLLGRREEAETELDWVLTRGEDLHFQYLAFLFRGRLHEEDGQLEAAAVDYRAAATLAPAGQTAHVALGHVLDRLGDLAASRESLDRAVSRSSRLLVPVDDWWVYPYGQMRRLESLLAELTIEARR
jgi:tetratricopeptide (TPR) repeat protein